MPRSSAASRMRVSRRQIVLTQRSIRLEGRVVPRLTAAVALGAASLEVDREADQPMPAPDRHGRDELIGIALRIPRPIGVVPHGNGSADYGHRRSPAPSAS